MKAIKSLYPEILFHFTDKKGLYGILEKSFSVSYAREKIIGSRKSTEFAVPMVSFCDLRLSELKNHIDKYGSYGIGLTKEWANDHGLNPVFYVNKDSFFTGDFIKGVEGIFSSIDSIEDGEIFGVAQKSYMGALNAYRYMKNYEGDLTRRNGIKTRKYRFADEREWRYVPPLGDTLRPFVPINDIGSKKQKAKFNREIANLRLRFKPDHIRYLIVESDGEINKLIAHLERAKRKYDRPTVQRLASRILTSKQISDDM